MFAIGPHEFTDQDIHTTLEAGWALFDLLELGLPAHATAVVEPHRVVAEAVLDEVVAGTTPPEDGLIAFWDEWHAAMAVLRRHGALGPSAMGTVTALFRSDGGVPKEPVEQIVVDWSGVVGDRQEDRRNHGRPWQALCLWSNEVIDAFAAQGNPLAPGRAGENITITGIDWVRMRPGVQLQIGDVRAEVSSYAVPCAKNRDWFTDGRFDRMHHKHGPISRIYATVLEPGTIEVGCPVLLEPDAFR
jgi:MOSC domain-containing protein YiiM